MLMSLLPFAGPSTFANTVVSGLSSLTFDFESPFDFFSSAAIGQKSVTYYARLSSFFNSKGVSSGIRTYVPL